VGRDFSSYDMQQCIRAAYDNETKALRMIVVGDPVVMSGGTTNTVKVVEKIVEVEKIVHVESKVNQYIEENLTNIYSEIVKLQDSVQQCEDMELKNNKELGESFSEALNSAFEKISKIETVVNNQGNVVTDLRRKTDKVVKENKIIKAVLLGSLILQILMLIF